MNARRVLSGSALVMVLAGCGLPPSGRVTTVDPTTVPFRLLQSSPPSSATSRPHGPTTQVYLVAHDHLATVPRRVVGQNIPAEAVRSLLNGATTMETTRGLTSDIPTETRLISLDLKGPVATVDLSEQFGTVGGTDQVLAVAQVVYTLTASTYINAVRFAINGKLIEVPNGSGSLAYTPRSRSDYHGLS